MGVRTKIRLFEVKNQGFADCKRTINRLEDACNEDNINLEEKTKYSIDSREEVV
jgi:hypothetical protein